MNGPNRPRDIAKGLFMVAGTLLATWVLFQTLALALGGLF